MRSPRIAYLKTLWETFNEEEFSGKLEPIPLLLKRFSFKDGQMYYIVRDGKYIPKSLEICESVYPNGDQLEGTMLHEMIHVYQCQVLNRLPNHDAIFCSIARRLERKHGVSVR